jgi:hypothetical protein
MTLPVPEKSTREAITFWLAIVSATGPVLAVVAGLWLKANVPSKAEHDSLAARVVEHSLTLAVMAEASKRDGLQDARLNDQEQRIRILERGHQAR